MLEFCLNLLFHLVELEVLLLVLLILLLQRLNHAHGLPKFFPGIIHFLCLPKSFWRVNFCSLINGVIKGILSHVCYGRGLLKILSAEQTFSGVAYDRGQRRTRYWIQFHALWSVGANIGLLKYLYRLRIFHGPIQRCQMLILFYLPNSFLNLRFLHVLLVMLLKIPILLRRGQKSVVYAEDLIYLGLSELNFSI
jgi:hypothetical protein